MFANPQQRTVAISVWITSFSVGGAIGPLLGGILLEWFWWGSVFLLAVPVMGLLLVLGPLLLPEFRDPGAGRLDLISAALSVAAVLAVIYGLKQLAYAGLGWPPAVSIAGGLAAGAVFIRRQHRLADPLLDLRLFRSAAFTAALTTNLLSFFTGFGALLFIAQYLQLVLGLSPLAAGLWMLPASAGTILGSMLTQVLGRRVRPAFVMAAGLALAAAGLGCSPCSVPPTWRLWWPGRWCFRCHWARSTPWPPTWPLGRPHRSGPGRRRRWPKPALNSAVHWALPSWVSSARVSTAAS